MSKEHRSQLKGLSVAKTGTTVAKTGIWGYDPMYRINTLINGEREASYAELFHIIYADALPLRKGSMTTRCLSCGLLIVTSFQRVQCGNVCVGGE